MEIQNMKSWVRGSALGSGSQATVYLAMSASDGKLMAVKTAAEGTAEGMYLHNELEILKQVQCPYVVQCFGGENTVEDGAKMFNVMMEYLPLGTISDLVRSFGGPLNESAIRSYMRCMLLGLQRIHKLGFIHGDIKGKNVLVGCDGNAKLADFGCSKRISGCSNDNQSLSGTPLWMAPEVISSQQQGPASDIWSLGCTIFEMASGKAPWSELFGGNQAINGMEAMLRIAMSEDVPSYENLKVSFLLKDFLSKCLVRDASKRWTSEELLAHPFISQDEWCTLVACPPSPTTMFDFHTSFSSSSSSLDSNKNGDVAVSPKDRFQKLAFGIDMGPSAQKKSGSLFDDVDADWIDVKKMPLTPFPVSVEASTFSLLQKSRVSEETSSSEECSTGGDMESDQSEQKAEELCNDGFAESLAHISGSLNLVESDENRGVAKSMHSEDESNSLEIEFLLDIAIKETRTNRDSNAYKLCNICPKTELNRPNSVLGASLHSKNIGHDNVHRKYLYINENKFQNILQNRLLLSVHVFFSTFQNSFYTLNLTIKILYLGADKVNREHGVDNGEYTSTSSRGR